ncbi:MAG TPA: hypothetical protein VGH19_23965 [Verrucomicrobiae bacterium]
MTLLPIVERELRVAARNPVTYRSRLMLPLIGGIMFLMFVLMSRGAPAVQMMGQQLFYLCFGALFGACLLAGSQLTADTLSSEKREGTLGFLFLTDLKGYDIVLGKMVSSSFGAVYAAFSILPLISVIFLFGGVSGGAMLRLVFSSLNVLFLSLAVGITCSCLSREADKARGSAMLTILALIASGPAIGLLNSYMQDFPRAHANIAHWAPFLISSPVMTFAASLDYLYGRSQALFWVSNGIVHAFGWAFMLSSCWLAPRTWQDKAASKREASWREWTRKFLYGTGEAMALYRARLLDINAVHWLTSRERFRGLQLWIALAAITGAWFLFYMVLGGADWWNMGMAFFFVIATNTIAKFMMAVESTKRFAADRESGALELLLCTEISVEDIIRGQLLSVRRRFTLPFIVIFGLGMLLFVMVGIQRPGSMQWETVVLIAVGYVVFWADYYVMPWWAMWMAMDSKIPKNAGVQAALFIMYGPWIATHFWRGIVSAITYYLFMVRVVPDLFIVFSWLLISLGFDIYAYKTARKRLHAEFRAIAMSRYVAPEKLTFLGWLGKVLGKGAARMKSKRGRA